MHPTHPAQDLSRRSFVKSAAALSAAAALAPSAIARGAYAGGSDEIRVGVIGCGGRGTGAAFDCLHADAGVRITALADVFQDRLDSCRAHLAGDTNFRERASPAGDRCYTGFDAYQRLLAEAECDMVILATSPGYRPLHFAAAVAAGKHVFMEKPAGVDPVGVRRVLAAADEADRRGLRVVAGTQRRHETCYLEAMKRVHDGAIGRIVSARCYWNQGGLWVHKRQPGWSDMEYQNRNWYYFAWLSGDNIVEQHVHNLDACNWAIGSTPSRCWGMGGREVRRAPEYGHIFDHHAVEYEYADGVVLHSFCRQIDGCVSRVEEIVHGTEGVLRTSSGSARITGKVNWQFDGKLNNNPYVQEHADLIAAIRSGTPLNEARTVAEATLTAVMGRMATYTGKEVTWDFALNQSKLDLSPPAYTFDAPLPEPPVAVPGQTPLV